jgi:hypothetical protein
VTGAIEYTKPMTILRAKGTLYMKKEGQDKWEEINTTPIPEKQSRTRTAGRFIKRMAFLVIETLIRRWLKK